MSEPEGTQLVTQLGDAVGGPEVPSDPDPETETVDLRRKLWNVQRLGESMAGDRDETVRRCGEQVLAVLGDAAEPDEIAALKRSCRILADITARNHQVMEAARIEMGQNGPHAAMQWILGALPDVWDDDETAWDGKESAEAWFDRTESFYRAAQADAEPAVPPPPVAAALDREAAADIDRDPMWHRAYMDVQKVLDEALGTEEEDGSGSGIAGDVWLLAHQRDAAREQAEAAEGKLAEMRRLCSEPLRARGFRPGTTGVIEEQYLRVEDILAITGSEKKGGAPYDRDFDGPVL